MPSQARSNIARLNRLAAPIDRAVVGESARWGDAKRATLDTIRDALIRCGDLSRRLLARQPDGGLGAR